MRHLIWLALMVWTACGWTATYYVAQLAPGTADGNAGTEALPLKSISAAVAKMQPGDTVLVKDGVYREEVGWAGGDWKDPEVRSTLAAFPGCKPVVKGSDVLAVAWERVEGERPIYSCARDVYTQMVFVDEEPLQQIGWQGHPERVPEKRGGFVWQRKWVGKGLADMTAGSFYYDAEGKRLYVWLADGGDPAAHVVEVAVRDFGISLQGTWTLSGFDVRHFMDGLWPDEQAVAVGGNRCIVEGCRIVQNEFLGLIVSGEDCVVRGNEIAYNGLMGFTSNVGYRTLFEGNELHHNAWRGDVECLTAGNKFVEWRDCKFVRNWWHDEPASALWLDIADGNILIAENRFDNCSVGIYFEISRWAVIVNNVFRQCGRGVWSYSSDVLVAHNVFDSCGEGVSVSGYVRHCNENQTVFEPGHEALMAVRNNLVVNNIFVDAGGCNVFLTPDDGYGAGNYSDYNAFVWTLPNSHPTGNHINFGYGWNAIYARLPEWEVARHQDTHSVISDPLMRKAMEYEPRWAAISIDRVLKDPGFVDRAVGDYRLRQDSVLRGKGVTLPGVLNSACEPCDGMVVKSRQWAKTLMVDAPAGVNAKPVYGGEKGHYRLQPLPRLGRLVDLDACAAGTPGLNEAWRASGAYPKFDASRPADVAGDDEWMVSPENKLADPSFDTAIGAAGPWMTGGEVHSFMGMACANLYPRHQGGLVAYQKLGKVAADCEVRVFGQMLVGSGHAQFGSVGELGFAVGDGLEAVGTPARIEVGPKQAQTWVTCEGSWKSGKAGEDAAIGKDLYVVLRGRVVGPADVEVGADPIAFVRWDNLAVLAGGM